MRGPIYIVYEGRYERRVLLVTRNLKSASAIYFRERSKINGLRPDVYAYTLGIEIGIFGDIEKIERQIGYDELHEAYYRFKEVRL